MADARLNIGVSADAKQASATFKELADDIKAVGKESVAVTDGVARVDAALAKLAKAPDTPMALARATAKAKLEIDELRAALEKTPASAEKMKAITAALAQADQAIEKSIARAGKLGEAQEEIKQKMGLTAKGAESLGNSFGSLDGIMSKMADSSSTLSQNIAKVGFSIMAAGQDFEFGYVKGSKFNNFIREHGNYLEKLIDLQIRQIDGLGSMSDLLSALPIKMNPVLKAHQANAAALAASTDQLKTLGIGFTTLSAQTDAFTQKAAAMNTALMSAKRTGETWDSLLKVNGASIKALAEEATRLNIPLEKLPPVLQKAVVDLKALQDAAAAVVPGLQDLATAIAGIGKGETVASIEAVAQALRLISLSGGDVGTAVAGNIDALMKLRTAAEGNYESLQKFRTEIMDQIPAYQATAMAMQEYAGTLEGIAAATAEYEAARRAANEADIEAGVRMAEFKERATEMARSIDTIGEAWVKATGQAAGFTVEVRRATKAAEESTPEFDALVESLAVVSDEYERMIPWVGALIAQLESGAIGTDEFRKQMEALQVGFMQIQGVSGQMFGDLDSLWAKLTAILNEFTRKGK